MAFLLEDEEQEIITSITLRLMEVSFRKPTRPSLPLKKEFFRKSSRPSLPLKKEFFRKSSRPSLPLKKAPPLISVFSPQGRRGKPPSVLTFLPLRLSCKESSTSNQAFLLRRKDVTALRCSEPLRSKVGGASKPSPNCAGWDRRGKCEYIISTAFI